MGLPPLFDEPQAQSSTTTLPPLFGESQSDVKSLPPLFGEIRNPVAEPWNLFPTTAGMIQHPGPMSALLPVAPIADLFRDVGVAGKTMVEQPLARQDMPFSTRLRKNLQSDRSLGSEYADNYIPALADKLVENGVPPEQVANELAVIHGGLSNALDIGGFFGTGGRQGVESLVQGGANIINRLRSGSRTQVPKIDLSTPQPVVSNIIEQGSPELPLAVDGTGQFNLTDVGQQAPVVKQKLKETPYENPIGPARDPGQQELNFTQGPSTPEVSTQAAPVPLFTSDSAPAASPVSTAPNMIEASAQPKLVPQDNVTQVSPQMQREIDQIARTPNPARSPAYRGLDKQQLQDLFVQRASKPVTVLPPDPAIEFARPQMKELSNPTNHADPFELIAGEQDRIRREQLIKDRQSVDDLVKREEASPGALADLKTILTEKNKRLGKKGAVGDLGDQTPVSDAERAAIDRWKVTHGPQLLKDFNSRAEDAATWVKKQYPTATAAEHAMMVQGISELKQGNKIENMNIGKYPEEQQKQIRELFKGNEAVLKTKPMTQKQMVEKAKDISTFPITESTLRSGEGQGAAELLRRKMSSVSQLKAIAEDPKLSAQEVIQKIQRLGLQDIKKISTEAGRTLGAGTIPVEAHVETLASMRKLVDRLREDPKLTSATSKALISELRKVNPGLDAHVTGAEIFKFLFRNFLTSGPLTLAANASSGVGAIAARAPMRALEVTSAKIRSLIGGKPTSATYKEIGAMLKGLHGALKGEQLPEQLVPKTFTDKYQASPLANLAATAKTKAGQKTLDVLDATIGYPERAMRATDDAVKNTLGMMEKYAAQARGEDVLNDQHVVDRITSAQSRLTFQDAMSMMGQSISRFRSSFSKGDPTLRRQAFDIATYSLQPFIQTVDRIIVGGFNLSGLGTVKTIAKMATGRYTGAISKGIKANESMGELLDRDVAAAMIGAPLFIWSGMQLAQRNITAGAPVDAGAREAFANTGKTEYSIKSNGRWIPTRLLPEPFATALQINLAVHQALAESKIAAEDAGTTAFKAALKVGTMLGTKQYLSGMNSLVSTLSNKGADTVNELPITKKILGAVAVPSIVKDVGVIKDTLLNRPRVVADTAIENVKRRAGMTSGMVPELNTFGEPVTHPMMGKVSNDPASILAEKFPPQPVERTRSGVKLTQQEYHDLKQNVGEQRKAVYTLLANNPVFQKATNGVQQFLTEQMVAVADEVGSTPQTIKELKSDPLYYDKELRTLLEIKKPGGERHFPFLK